MSKLKNVPVITDECKEAFQKLSTLNIKNFQDFDALAKSIGYTDKNFVKFLKDTSYSEKTLDNYNQYLQKASSSTAKFAATLKSIGVNIAIMLAINLAIKAATELWDYYNVTVAEVQEEIDAINDKLSTLNGELEDLLAKDPARRTDAEKERIKYLKERIELEEQLLEQQQKRQAAEILGNKLACLKIYNVSIYTSQLKP